ncbi:hypothetical protein [Helicobacter kayseriensis]|nr:hypothetical protein [Helicobacter kayseriensis]MCE3047864.1 hypothetical protein [Helicobacter kayseriensis]
MKYALFEQDDVLHLWIDCEGVASAELEQLVQKLSCLIPQSLFVTDIDSKILEGPSLPIKKEFEPFLTFSYCPSCLKTSEGEICEVCQKKIPPLTKDIKEIASLLLEGSNVEVITESGSHILSVQPSPRLFCIELDHILTKCNLTSKELEALMSYEKPIVKTRASQDFASQVQAFDLYVSLAHDLQLLKLFWTLKNHGIQFLYGAQNASFRFELAPVVQTPLKILVLENDHRVMILKNPSPSRALKEKFVQYSKRDKAFLSSILEENQIQNQNILNFYFSSKGEDRICLYNTQTQWFNEVMSFDLPKDLWTLFDWIAQDGESGEKLMENYRHIFPNLCQSNVSFKGFPQGIMGVWEIARNVLGLKENPLDLANLHLTQRGVAIDYSFVQDSLIGQKFQLVKCIRSGMSFKLAGVEDGVIALGYIESFSLFPSKLYLSLRQLIEIEGISLSGDLFSSKMIGDFFYRNNRQTPIYRNITFPLLYP